MRCAYLSTGALIGFTLNNGYTRTSGDQFYDQSGGGVLLDNGGTVSNCVVTGCYAAGYYGSGVHCEGNGGTLNNCIITGNLANSSTEGGGVYMNSGGTLNNCTVSGNGTNSSEGGGVYMDHGGTLNNCVISGNSSFLGGGVFCYYGGLVNACIISNNAVVASAGSGGGGVWCQDGGTLYSCLIIGNNGGGGSGLGGGGVCFEYGGTAYNCTIVSNTVANNPGGGVNFEGGGTLINGILYNNTNPGYNSADANYYNDGSGTLQNNYSSGDPLFVNPAAGNYQLQAASPCINAGVNASWMLGATDLAGTRRIVGGTVDMGAYEYQPTPPANCLQFNGTNSYVNLGTNSALALTNGAFTIEAWIKPILQSNICTIIGRKNGGNANPGYAFYLNSWNTGDGALKFESQGVQESTAAQAIQWGVWQHVAATWNGANFLFYINGVSQAASGSVNLTNGGVNLFLGCLGNLSATGDYFAGQMDEVRIWSIARSASDLQDGMHHVFTGSEPGLLAYYQFDQSSGTNLPDCTTNGNNGILVNNPVWTNSTFPCANVIASFNNIRGAWIDQTDSLGSTILSVSNAVVNGTDFRVFGNDGGPLTQNTSDLPPNFAWRLDRAWQMEGVGAVSGGVAIDCTSLSNLIGNSFFLYLLAATNSTIANATAIPGTYAGNVFWVSGQSLQSGSYYTIGESNGVAVFTINPGITSFSLTNASNVVISGTNGEADAAYYLLSSTNVALPMNQWRTVATNILGGNGAFTFIGTNAVTPGSGHQFYLLSNTNYNP